jgi:hypothetical protein
MSKKGEKSNKGESSYELRDVVLAKVRGYPPWPGMVRFAYCYFHLSVKLVSQQSSVTSWHVDC